MRAASEEQDVGSRFGEAAAEIAADPARADHRDSHAARHRSMVMECSWFDRLTMSMWVCSAHPELVEG